MDKKVMNRKASDNEYLHKNYGEEAVMEYLKKFTEAFYTPLIKDFKESSFIAPKEHFERIYAIEGGDVEISLKCDELIIIVRKCPAVTYMSDNNKPVAEFFHETTRTVN